MGDQSTPTQRTVLVINDGSLAALVVSMMERETGGVVAWVPPPGSALSQDAPENPRSADLVREQAALLGYAQVRMVDGEPLAEGDDAGLETSLLLMSAVADAARLGCERVVWPVVCGADLEMMQRASERASLVSRLAWLEEHTSLSGVGAVTTPLVDLTHGQVEEMACDLDAPEGVSLGEAPVGGLGGV